jgi:hypothetical protein
MDITLCLGFCCYIYKKPPTVRIYVDNFFIDEFELTDSMPKNKVTDFINVINSFRKTDSRRFVSELDPTLYLDKTDINKNIKIMFFNMKNLNFNNKKSCNLKIEVKNNDTNYNNGFISNSTLVSLPIVFITSTKILENFKNFFMKYDKMYKKRQKIYNDINAIKNFYKTKQNFLSPFTPQSLYFYQEQSKRKISSYFFGGNGEFIFTFYKKYNTLIENIDIGYKKINQKDAGYLLSLSDKYIQYAN